MGARPASSHGLRSRCCPPCRRPGLAWCRSASSTSFARGGGTPRSGCAGSLVSHRCSLRAWPALPRSLGRGKPLAALGETAVHVHPRIRCRPVGIRRFAACLNVRIAPCRRRCASALRRVAVVWLFAAVLAFVAKTRPNRSLNLTHHGGPALCIVHLVFLRLWRSRRGGQVSSTFGVTTAPTVAA